MFLYILLFALHMKFIRKTMTICEWVFSFNVGVLQQYKEVGSNRWGSQNYNWNLFSLPLFLQRFVFFLPLNSIDRIILSEFLPYVCCCIKCILRLLFWPSLGQRYFEISAILEKVPIERKNRNWNGYWTNQTSITYNCICIVFDEDLHRIQLWSDITVQCSCDNFSGRIVAQMFESSELNGMNN